MTAATRAKKLARAVLDGSARLDDVRELATLVLAEATPAKPAKLDLERAARRLQDPAFREAFNGAQFAEETLRRARVTARYTCDCGAPVRAPLPDGQFCNACVEHRRQSEERERQL